MMSRPNNHALLTAAIKADPSTANLKRLATEYGRSLKTLRRHARRLGFGSARRPWTTKEIARLREAYSEGVSVRDLAAELGRAVHAVYERSRRIGIKKFRKHERLVTPSQIETAIRVVKAGHGPTTAARVAGLRISEVRKQMSIRGIECPPRHINVIRAAVVNSNETRRRAVADRGWPYGTTKRQCRLAEALERLGREATAEEIAEEAGYPSLVPPYQMALRDLTKSGVLTRRREPGRSARWVYSLAPSTVLSRETRRATASARSAHSDDFGDCVDGEVAELIEASARRKADSVYDLLDVRGEDAATGMRIVRRTS